VAPAAAFTGARRAALLTALGVVGAVILLFRLDPSTWNTLWAEDGTIFVTGALRSDPHVILDPYAGYLHVIPRLEAFVAVLFPLDVVPTVVTVLAAVTAAATAVAVFVFAEHRIASPWLRGAVWLGFVTMPLAASEVADSIANLHWYFMIAEFWALLIAARSRGVLVLQIVAVVAAVICDPLALLAAPVLLVRVIARGRRELPLVVAFIASGALQLYGVMQAQLVGHQRTFDAGPISISKLIDFYAGQIATPTLFGVRLTDWLALHIPTTLAGISLSVVVVALVVAGIRWPSRRAAMIAFPLASLFFITTLLVLQGGGLFQIPAFRFDVGARYYLIPVFLLMSALLIALDGVVDGPARWRRVLAVLCLVWVGVLGVLDYRVFEPRSGGPSWDGELRRAETVCAGPTSSSVVVPITPSFMPGVSIDCDRLP
jgi:hypothetical protein